MRHVCSGKVSGKSAARSSSLGGLLLAGGLGFAGLGLEALDAALAADFLFNLVVLFAHGDSGGVVEGSVMGRDDA